MRTWTGFLKRVSGLTMYGCTEKGPGQVQERGLAAMDPVILYINVHIGLRLGKEPESLVSYYAGLVPCTCS